MQKFAGALVLVFAMFALAAAEEFGAVVTKFEDGKITFKKFKKGEKGGGEATTLTVAEKCKYMKGKFNQEEKKFEVDGELEGGKDAFAKRVKESAAKKPDDNPDKK